MATRALASPCDWFSRGAVQDSGLMHEAACGPAVSVAGAGGLANNFSVPNSSAEAVPAKVPTMQIAVKYCLIIACYPKLKIKLPTPYNNHTGNT